MTPQRERRAAAARPHFRPLVDRSPDRATFRHDVLTGLRRQPKTLPCKYFYDERGSQLFDHICELEEYYLTRTELAIMRRYAPEMAAALGSGCLLVELGSGSSLKTRLLLDHLEPVAYVPVDISREHLAKAAAALAADYPSLEVRPVSADYTEDFSLPPVPGTERVAVYFPGSTVGNFSREAAQRFLTRIARLVGAGGALLIGVDLDKDRAILEPAYNDREGVTAAFNLNLLARINRELDGDFDLDHFRHHAFYNAADGRMEIFLVSRAAHSVRIGDARVEFAEGEAICTEHSYKYDLADFRKLAQAAGFCVERVWSDERRYFSVQYLTV